jgi:hypothetical protein
VNSPNTSSSPVLAATTLPDNLTITATIDHADGTVTIVATTVGENGHQVVVPVLPRTLVADPSRTTTTCTIDARGASGWSTRNDSSPRIWPQGAHQYAFDTTTDLRVRVLSNSEEEARQEVLAGSGDFMELYCELGPLLVTTGTVQAIDELVEVVDQDGNLAETA